MVDIPALTSAAADFVKVIDRLYGLYLDAQMGFDKNADEITWAQGKMTTPTPRSLPLLIGRGDPTDPSNVTQHQTTQGEFIDRNTRSGDNHVQMGRLLVAMLFSYWEAEYRARLAKALGYGEPSELKNDLFGDLRPLRHEVMHHGGLVTPETIAKLKVLKVQVGPLVLDEMNVEIIGRAAKAALDRIVVDAGGADPLHRRVWRV